MDTTQIVQEVPVWLQMWQGRAWHIAAFCCLLLAVFAVMIFRDALAGRPRLLNFVRYGVLGVSFFYVGLYLRGQPTSTNVVIGLTSLRQGAFPLTLYLMEPFIFLFFIFMAVTISVWGRGVFCGWLCPYGAMLELFRKAMGFFTKFSVKPDFSLHRRLSIIKFIALAAIFGVSLYSFILSEYFTEIEPFRTLVLMRIHPLKLEFSFGRPWYFVTYFVLLSAASAVVLRAFCMYLCPLGALISIPAFARVFPLLKLKRYDLCGKCRICEKSCDYNAIKPDGTVDAVNCMQCLDCQVNYRDAKRCPARMALKKSGEAVG
jgi:NosR/NirI family nitrous oxide reductase transcriptional regulator